MFLSRADLTPVPIAAQIRADLMADATINGCVNHEFLASQLEYSSPVFTEASVALRSIGTFRNCLADAAAGHGVVAVGVGLPFTTDERPIITDDDRYRNIRSGIRGLIKDHQMNAMHVHVGIDSRDQGVRALNTVRVWIPTLLALSVNAPFWRGEETGFASWRSILARRWATSGCPPYFQDAEDYAERTAQIVKVGAAADQGAIAWGARLSEKYPTIEIRVCDSQLDAESTIFLAVLMRALVETAAGSCGADDQSSELLDAALWKAARDGLSNTLVHPLSAELASAHDVVSDLLRYVRPALESNGDFQLVDEGVALRFRDGTGAHRQREAFRNAGPSGLRTLFVTCLTAR